MKSLLQLILDYHSGVKNADEEILKRMEPLIKSYASRIHCMERDDAIVSSQSTQNVLESPSLQSS